MSRSGFRSRDGVALSYVDEGNGLPVLWQHGLGATQAQAQKVFPQAEGLRRITLECRGHGASGLGPADALSIEQFTDDAVALLDRLHIERAVVGGISLGAAIALRMAATRRERVLAQVLARPAWVAERGPERLKIYLDVADLLAEYGADEGLQRLQASARYRMVLQRSPDNAASMRGFFTRENPKSTVALLRRIPAQGPGVSGEQMARLDVPTLVIANEEDYVHPLAVARTIADLIPGATLAVIPGKTRDETPYVEAFRSALQAFLSAIGSGR